MKHLLLLVWAMLAGGSGATPDITIHRHVDLVLVHVTVVNTATLNPVIGLQQGHFRVFDNKKEQTIKYFSSDDEPASIGIVLDRSGSMQNKWEYAIQGVKSMCDESNPKDEFMLTTFADRIDVSPFTDAPDTEYSRLPFQEPKGKTAVIDALYATVQKIKNEAQYDRRAVLLITDGGSNNDRYTPGALKKLLQEADVPVFVIGLFEPQPPTDEERRGPDLLADIADESGGLGVVVQKMDDIKLAAEYFGALIRNEYVIGFQPKNLPRDHQHHRLSVKLQHLPKGLPPLVAHFQTGYYGPSE